jgi:hypothetical protein
MTQMNLAEMEAKWITRELRASPLALPLPAPRDIEAGKIA